MATTTSLPSGREIFTKMPDLLFIPELVVGGLVWILLAPTLMPIPNPQGWVMFVSVLCFVITTIWFICFLSGLNQSSSYWPALDVSYHAIAAAFYLSAAVIQAFLAIFINSSLRLISQLNIAAVVMAYLATLLYTVHTVFSAIRWKSS